jgi:hypothetical protein
LLHNKDGDVISPSLLNGQIVVLVYVFIQACIADKNEMNKKKKAVVLA